MYIYIYIYIYTHIHITLCVVDHDKQNQQVQNMIATDTDKLVRTQSNNAINHDTHNDTTFLLSLI